MSQRRDEFSQCRTNEEAAEQPNPLAILDLSDAEYDPSLRIYNKVGMSLRQLVHIVLTMEPDATATQVAQRIHGLRCLPVPVNEIEREYQRSRAKCVATDYMIIRGTGYRDGDSPWMSVEACLFPMRRRFDSSSFDFAPADSIEFHRQIEASYAIKSANSGMRLKIWDRRYIEPLRRAIKKRRLNCATAAAALQVILGQCRVDLLTERDWKTLRDDMNMSPVGGIRFR